MVYGDEEVLRKGEEMGGRLPVWRGGLVGGGALWVWVMGYTDWLWRGGTNGDGEGEGGEGGRVGGREVGGGRCVGRDTSKYKLPLIYSLYSAPSIPPLIIMMVGGEGRGRSPAYSHAW